MWKVKRDVRSVCPGVFVEGQSHEYGAVCLSGNRAISFNSLKGYLLLSIWTGERGNTRFTPRSLVTDDIGN